MTISIEQQRVSYAGNGMTTAFSVPFRFLADSDLVVILVDDTTGAPTLQTLTTDYTVSGAGNPNGGTVTFVTAPASGKTVRIWGDPALTQLVDYIAGGPLPAESHEEALDRVTLQQKRTREIAERSLHLPDADADGIGTEIPNAVERSDMVLGFDASGEPKLYSPTDPVFTVLTPNRAIRSDGQGLLEASDVTSTAQGYTQNLTSDAQAQIDALSSQISELNVLQLVDSGTVSALSQKDFILPSGFDRFFLTFKAMQFGSDANSLFMQVSSDGGVSYDSAGEDYKWATSFADDDINSGVDTSGNTGLKNSIHIASRTLTPLGNAQAVGTIEIVPQGASQLAWSVRYRGAAGIQVFCSGGGRYAKTGEIVDAIRLRAADTFSFPWRLYGLE